MAHGGEAVGRIGGKAVFVDGALPGETVVVDILEERGSWARAMLVSVVEASPERIEPLCGHFGHCGGCQWQFASRETQAEWKHDVVAGQLQHLGRIIDADVRPTLKPGPDFGYRNRMDFRVERGRPALYRRRSKEREALDECPILSDELASMLDEVGDLTPLDRITLRAGSNTGDRLAIVSGEVPEEAGGWSFPVCRVRRGRAEPIHGAPYLTEKVGGTTFRVTASAFFQNNTAGAEALADLVGEALQLTEEDILLDAYAGGGLFALTSGRGAGRVLAIESAGLAAADLAYNSRNVGVEVEVVAASVETGIGGENWTAVVCDPPRTGLGAAGVEALVGPGPRVIAYVACDPASLARDARLLRQAGYDLDYAVPVDMFPQTFHIETVARFQLR